MRTSIARSGRGTKRVRVRRRALILCAFMSLLVTSLNGGTASAVDSEPVSGDDVTPELVAGNPSCATLNADNTNFPSITSDIGFKIDGWDNATFPTSGYPGYLSFSLTTGTQNGFPTQVTGGGPADTTNSVQVRSEFGILFDWIASLGIDAVIVKGGPNSNAYVYVPEDTADSGLGSPGAPPAPEISHVEFCYDYELTVSKTAETSFTRTFPWDIDKSVTPDEWDLFTGDSGTSKYSITVTKGDPVDSDWAVNGTITIENETPFSASITDVTDSISGVGAADVLCPGGTSQSLAAGATLSCTYSKALNDATDRVNTATVTTTGAVGGGSATADVDFGDPTTVVNDEIKVDDTNAAGDFGPVGVTTTHTYTRTFDCDADEGEHDNTATIVETEQESSASVTVNCNELAVSKDADTSLTRTWDWTIDKEADETDLTLMPGQLFTVDYDVTVDASSTDSDHAVSGDIEVHNPALIAAELTAVSDIVSGAGAANVNCGVTFPHTLVAGGTLNCTYTADLPNADNRTNTATATLQNYSYDEEGTAAASGTTDFSGSANVSFANATVDEIDECVDVEDTNKGVLGEVCAADAPKTFEYSLTFGQHPDADVQLECGDNSHDNTATCTTNDTGTEDTDSVTVDAFVACDRGCTLTQGYWKTHSHLGPAPEDDAWFNLGDVDGDGMSEGAGETFFSSGRTYYQILWTPPSGGNAYLNLAHQYIAAKLNILNGADSTAAVDAAIAYAESFFPGKTPSTSLTKPVKNTVLGHASTLDRYNNGLIGPGHCSEDESSAA